MHPPSILRSSSVPLTYLVHEMCRIIKAAIGRKWEHVVYTCCIRGQVQYKHNQTPATAPAFVSHYFNIVLTKHSVVRTKPPAALFVLFIIAHAALLSACKHERTTHAERKTIVESVYASGKIVAENEYTLYALSNGTVSKKLVNDGDTVRKGQALYIINSDAPLAGAEAANQNYQTARQNLASGSPILKGLKLELESAAIKLRNDSLNYYRMKNLWTQSIGTKANLDNAYAVYQLSQAQKRAAGEKYLSTVNELKLQLSAARSQMVTAQSNLKNYYIKSESDGIVYQTLKEAGEAVRMSEPVALLGDKSQRVIRLAVDQQDIDKIEPGQKVLLKTDVANDKIVEAVVKSIYPVMNPADQTFRVDAVFTNAPSQPFIHNSVEANIVIGTKNNALVITRDALHHEDSLLVMRDGKQQMLKIKPGIKTLDEVEILAGIEESTPVVLPANK